MIGTGHVGLVTGVCSSDFGHEVVCVDRLPDRVAQLAAGRVPIYESGLEVILTEWNQLRALDLKRLATAMATPRLADLRNIYNPEDGIAAGFAGVGRSRRRET